MRFCVAARAAWRALSGHYGRVSTRRLAVVGAIAFVALGAACTDVRDTPENALLTFANRTVLDDADPLELVCADARLEIEAGEGAASIWYAVIEDDVGNFVIDELSGATGGTATVHFGVRRLNVSAQLPLEEWTAEMRREDGDWKVCNISGF
jgi:hypothetical protein